MNIVNDFCRVLVERSEENKKTFSLLYANRLYGNCFSVLRQEIDSMIRAIYILSKTDFEERRRLISLTMNGEKWFYINDRGRSVNITDKYMVDISNRLHGWTKSVYKFGCGFIHLSNNHNYNNENPFNKISHEEKTDIINHIEYYHGVTLNLNSTLQDFIPVLPSIMYKISDNLSCYITHIENQDILDYF